MDLMITEENQICEKKSIVSSNLINSVVSEIFTFLALLGAEKNPIVRSSAEGRGQSLLAVNVSI